MVKWSVLVSIVVVLLIMAGQSVWSVSYLQLVNIVDQCTVIQCCSVLSIVLPIMIS